MVTEARNILNMKGVSFRYNKEPVFENINCTVKKGDMVGIIWWNGSGKTTLVKLMLGLLKPEKGSVEWALEWEKDGSTTWRMQYVAQDVTHTKSLLPMSVEEVVSTGMYFASMENHTHVEECCYDSIDRALQHVGIAELRNKKINELSWGQRQRVYIARSLIAHPEVLIMDEPLTGVDSDAQKQLYALLEHLNRIHGITIIMISHDEEEVRKYMRTIIAVWDYEAHKLEETFPSQHIVYLK